MQIRGAVGMFALKGEGAMVAMVVKDSGGVGELTSSNIVMITTQKRNEKRMEGLGFNRGRKMQWPHGKRATTRALPSKGSRSERRKDAPLSVGCKQRKGKENIVELVL